MMKKDLTCHLNLSNTCALYVNAVSEQPKAKIPQKLFSKKEFNKIFCQNHNTLNLVLSTASIKFKAIILA